MSKTAFVFPGQGSQFIGMGKDLYENSPAAKDVFDKVDEALGTPFSRLIFEGDEAELKRTVNAQPALLTACLATLAAIREMRPDALEAPAFVAGHSLGEYTALAAADALSLTDAVLLARTRGELMQKAADDHPGGMIAVIGLDTETVERIAKESGVEVANYNSPGQIILSGEQDKLFAAEDACYDADARMVVPLQVSGAFHSCLMQDAQDGLNQELEATAFQAPAVPVVGNTTATALDATPEAIRAELENQLCHSVRWIESVEYMVAEGVNTFVEIGPGNVLSKLIARIAPEAKTLTVGTLDEIRAL